MDLTGFESLLPQEFELPTGAKAGTNGTQQYEWGEQRNIVPHRFAVYARPLIEKSKAQGFLEHEEVHLCQFYKSKKDMTPIRMRRAKNVHGEFTGKWELPIHMRHEPFITEYKRFLEGRDQAGTHLDRWGEANTAQVATLTNMGIFTVEGFAELAEQWIQQNFPAAVVESYLELHEMAIMTVAAKGDMGQAKELGDKMMALQSQNDRLAKELEEMKAMMKGQEEPKAKAKAKAKSKAKKRGRPKKVEGATVEGGEIKLEGEE